jgi:hypothetical protein
MAHLAHRGKRRVLVADLIHGNRLLIRTSRTLCPSGLIALVMPPLFETEERCGTPQDSEDLAEVAAESLNDWLHSGLRE